MASNTRLYIILIILCSIALGYFYYTDVSVPNEIPSSFGLTSSNSDGLSTFQNLNLNFSILNDATYKTFIVNGEVPVNPGVTGRKDLFAGQ